MIVFDPSLLPVDPAVGLANLTYGYSGSDDLTELAEEPTIPIYVDTPFNVREVSKQEERGKWRYIMAKRKKNDIHFICSVLLPAHTYTNVCACRQQLCFVYLCRRENVPLCKLAKCTGST